MSQSTSSGRSPCARRNRNCSAPMASQPRPTYSRWPSAATPSAPLGRTDPYPRSTSVMCRSRFRADSHRRSAPAVTEKRSLAGPPEGGRLGHQWPGPESGDGGWRGQLGAMPCCASRSSWRALASHVRVVRLRLVAGPRFCQIGQARANGRGLADSGGAANAGEHPARRCGAVARPTAGPYTTRSDEAADRHP